jgi:hypothetical protein
MPSVNFAETLGRAQLLRRPRPESRLAAASAGLLSDHEDGGEMLFRNMLSQVMAGGCGENHESLPHSIYRHSPVGLVERVCDRERERQNRRHQSVFVGMSSSANVAARWH